MNKTLKIIALVFLGLALALLIINLVCCTTYASAESASTVSDIPVPWVPSTVTMTPSYIHYREYATNTWSNLNVSTGVQGGRLSVYFRGEYYFGFTVPQGTFASQTDELGAYNNLLEFNINFAASQVINRVQNYPFVRIISRYDGHTYLFDYFLPIFKTDNYNTYFISFNYPLNFTYDGVFMGYLNDNYMLFKTPSLAEVLYHATQVEFYVKCTGASTSEDYTDSTIIWSGTSDGPSLKVYAPSVDPTNNALYLAGYAAGNSDGYNSGYAAASTAISSPFNVAKTVFAGILDILDVPIFGENFTIGSILTIVVALGLIGFLFKLGGEK